MSQLTPPAVPHELVHTRQITFRGYLQEDKLWNIEAELVDTKPYDFVMPHRSVEAGEPIHSMAIRLTIDDQMTVRDVVTSMKYAPLDECRLVLNPMQSIIGLTMGPGWRGAIDKVIGGTKGCTHMRDLLYNAATAAYLMIPSYKAYLLRKAGKPVPPYITPPPQLGKCLPWTLDGPLTKRFMPQFYARKDSSGDES